MSDPYDDLLKSLKNGRRICVVGIAILYAVFLPMKAAGLLVRAPWPMIIAGPVIVFLPLFILLGLPTFAIRKGISSHSWKYVALEILLLVLCVLLAFAVYAISGIL